MDARACTGAARGASPAPDETSTTLPSPIMRRIGRFAAERNVQVQSSPGSSGLRRWAGSHATGSPNMLSVRSTVARIPAVSRRLPRVAGANNAAVARTWYLPAARLAIRYRPAMSVYAVPTLPDAAETASTSAPICATPWMSRTTPLTVAAEAATIMPRRQ